MTAIFFTSFTILQNEDATFLNPAETKTERDFACTRMKNLKLKVFKKIRQI